MYVNNNTWDLADTVKLYEKSGNFENYIKETKNDINMGSLKMKFFWANELFFTDHDIAIQYILVI